MSEVMPDQKIANTTRYHRILKRCVYSLTIIVTICLIPFLFGTPHFLHGTGNDWTVYTRGGYFTLQAWSDHYGYGAFIGEVEKIPPVNAESPEGSQVRWWLRLEIFKY